MLSMNTQSLTRCPNRFNQSLTNSKKQPFLEANSSSPGQEISRISCNTCSFCPYPEPDQPGPQPSPTISLNSISINPLMARSSMWPLSFRFSHQIPALSSPLPMRATFPAHLILLDLTITKLPFFLFISASFSRIFLVCPSI